MTCGLARWFEPKPRTASRDQRRLRFRVTKLIAEHRMKIRINGERAGIDKSVEVEVIKEHERIYSVRHTDGKRACIAKCGGCYHRMPGTKVITLMKHCTVEVL